MLWVATACACVCAAVLLYARIDLFARMHGEYIGECGHEH